MVNFENENIKQRSGFVGFIPKSLKINDRPELSIFPLNVLIGRYTIRDGKKMFGSALYEPDISSFIEDKESGIMSMRFYNKYNHDYWLEMEYEFKNKKRRCQKMCKGEQCGIAFGGENWNGFFVQVSFLGLYEGETCKFDEVKG